MQSTELLVEARRRVAGGWCQNGQAVAPGGEAVEPWSGDAHAWSLLGAIIAAFEASGETRGGGVQLTQLALALAALADEIEEPSLAAWNDERSRTQREVVGVLERAIAQLEV